MRSFANILIYFGLICLILCGFLYWQRTTPRRLQFNEVENSLVQQNEVEGSVPKVLVIEDLGINLDIYPAAIKKNQWEATDKGVSYLSSTPIPGERGNSVIYGHNWKNLLGNLTSIKPGQEVKIIYADGTSQIFEVKFVQTVTADQTEVLKESDDARITLYTCSGFLDSKRFVVTAVKK